MAFVGELIELSDTAVILSVAGASGEPPRLVHIARAVAQNRSHFKGAGFVRLSATGSHDDRLRSLARFPYGMDRSRMGALIDALRAPFIIFVHGRGTDTVAVRDALIRWPLRSP